MIIYCCVVSLINMISLDDENLSLAMDSIRLSFFVIVTLMEHHVFFFDFLDPCTFLLPKYYKLVVVSDQCREVRNI